MTDTIRQDLEELVALGRWPEIVALADELRQTSNDHTFAAEIWSKTLLFTRQRLPEAVEYARDWLELEGPRFDTLFHLAQCLHRDGKTLEALSVIDDALQLEPQHYEGRLERSLLLFFLGRYQETRAILEELLLERRDDPRVLYNLGWFSLREGRLHEGLKLLERGRPIGNFGRPDFGSDLSALPSSLRRKKVWLKGEAGLGDQIIGVRFVNELLKRKADKVIVTTHSSLVPLFAHSFPDAEILPEEEAFQINGVDFEIPMMSAPLRLRLFENELSTGSYLRPTRTAVENWTKRPHVQKTRVLKVGLRWQGSTECEPDMQRTLPARDLFQLQKLNGVHLYSFQRDAGAEAIRGVTGVEDLGPELKTWDDTVAALSQMDVLITSCTSTAHAAAAAGVRTWVLIPQASYYIWAHAGSRSPWYDSVRLFRQKTAGRWDECLSEVACELRKLASR